MKVYIQGFHGLCHSWSYVNQNIARHLFKLGHEVHLKSTNTYELFPDDLKSCIREKLDDSYCLSLSYTAPTNWPIYLSRGKKKFGIWCYEWPILPPGFAKYHRFVDKILAPSNFARDIFVANKVPEDKVVVVPHGINVEQYQSKEKYPLKTKKKKIIGIVLGQAHFRKNVPGMLEAFGRAFTNKDDVCLVAKISAKKKLTQQFEVNVWEIFDNFKRKYKNHAEIELITDYVPDIVSLYNACDIVYTLSYSECFFLPAIEANYLGKLNICPRYGGQLDFLNDSNSLLIDGKIIRAEPKMQYWSANIHNTCFEADVNDAASKLRQAVFNYDELMEKFKPNMIDVAEKYTWEKVVDQIIDLAK